MEEKKQRKPKKQQPSAQEINRLEDIVYRYGGESMILRMKECTPIEVLQAYETLNEIHGGGASKQRAVFVREKQKTMGQIKSIVFNSCKTYLPMIPRGFPRLDSASVVGSSTQWRLCFDQHCTPKRAVLHGIQCSMGILDQEGATPLKK